MAPTDQTPVRVGYLVSRFPSLTETFVLRELRAVDAVPGVEVVLMSLFAGDDGTVHPDARPWVARRHRPATRGILGAVLRAAVRRPGRSAAVWARVVRDHAAAPRVLAKALATTAAAFALAEHVQRTGVRHVHAHFASMPALAAWVVGRLTGVPYSTTAHAHDVFLHQTGLATRLRAARFVVAISTYHRMFLAHIGARPATTPLLPLGLDLERHAFRPRPIPPDGPVDVLCVSSLQVHKGHRFLLEALAGDRRLDRLRLDIVGAGPLRAELEALAARLGLADRVTFSGALDEAEVLRRLGEAHLLVQPSIVGEDGRTEGLPTTLVEAGASGIAMVATRVTGVPDLVRDGGTGFLAAPADAPDLAAALGRALDHGDLAAVLRAARDHVEAHHDLSRVAPTLARWFVASANGDAFAADPAPAGSDGARTPDPARPAHDEVPAPRPGRPGAPS